ncbi:MAG: hypothetical protein MI863_15755 [Desulfobacterales bacterium]|nr:hypothetical protein [Desulfobacterales bacterium]
MITSDATGLHAILDDTCDSLAAKGKVLAACTHLPRWCKRIKSSCLN